jgi:uncharacterized protein (TIGR02145 family)
MTFLKLMNYQIIFLFALFVSNSFAQKKNEQIINRKIQQLDSSLILSEKKMDSLVKSVSQISERNHYLEMKIDSLEFENQLRMIGNQNWDKSNLMVKTLNDGTPIFYADTRQKWDSLFLIQKPAYCLHKNDSLGLFGYIYNYYAVSSGKLAPEGMRIPSKEDVNELIRFNQLINGKGAILLKSNDSISNHFPEWKKRGLDIFQMGIRPLGFRLDDSKEWYFGNKIYFWCQITDPKKINLMAITEINDDPFILEKTIEEKNSNYGLYVRCIK